MRSKLIAIAIGIALILGIVLIGGIRITRANELSNKVLASRVLRLNQLQHVDLDSQKGLVMSGLSRMRKDRTVLDRNLLNGVGLLNPLDDTHTARHGLTLGLLVETL